MVKNALENPWNSRKGIDFLTSILVKRFQRFEKFQFIVDFDLTQVHSTGTLYRSILYYRMYLACRYLTRIAFDLFEKVKHNAGWNLIVLLNVISVASCRIRSTVIYNACNTNKKIHIMLDSKDKIDALRYKATAVSKLYASCSALCTSLCKESNSQYLLTQLSKITPYTYCLYQFFFPYVHFPIKLFILLIWL